MQARILNWDAVFNPLTFVENVTCKISESTTSWHMPQHAIGFICNNSLSAVSLNCNMITLSLSVSSKVNSF